MITFVSSPKQLTRPDSKTVSRSHTVVPGSPLDAASPLATRRELESVMRNDGPRFLAVARRYLKCDAECADAVQDAFVSALRNLQNFHGSSQLETWLHRIVVNACLMKIRSNARHVSVPLDCLGAMSENSTGNQAICQAESNRIIRDAVSRLPEKQREVIRLRYFEGFNTAEAAERLGVNISVLKTRLHRSCRALRCILEERINDDL